MNLANDAVLFCFGCVLNLPPRDAIVANKGFRLGIPTYQNVIG